MRRIVAGFLLVLFILTTACSVPDFALPAETTVPKESVATTGTYLDITLSPEERAADLLSRMTLEEKAGQMVQGVFYATTPADMRDLGVGSILSGGGGVPQNNTPTGWQEMVRSFQEGAMASRLGIPFLYGIDAVHGHSNLYQAVIFPQNIGLGAANDPEKMYQMGAAVADEMKLTHILWNFSPCVAVSTDPRWGRSYESFSQDPEIVAALATMYAQGQADSGIIATAKHYAGDGGTVFGTGEGEYLIDRGDAQMTEESFRALHLVPYEALVEAGVPVVMASFSSFNGVKMSESKYWLTDVLKGEMAFAGFVVSDWEAVSGLSGDSFSSNVVLAINAGVDMLMEPERFREARLAIIDGVNNGQIDISRVDDAVRRILTVKFDYGLFEDPYMENLTLKEDVLGSEDYRYLAKSLVEESLVLLKNDNDILPLTSGTKVFVTGPALNDLGVQCGGWTMTWQGMTDAENGKEITVGTTILEGLQAYAEKAGIEIITDGSRIGEADVVLLVVGEKPYAEYEGDTATLALDGPTGLPGNMEAISLATSSGAPVIALVVAGRQMDIDSYLADWDAAVMCYLPGTEGDGVAAVLTGEAGFSGKLPFPWYADTADIGTDKVLFPMGYGITYTE